MMKTAALAIAILAGSFSFAQEFMTKQEFTDSLPEQKKMQIRAQAESRWRKELTPDDIYCVNYTMGKMSKKVNLTWELHHDYYSNVDGFQATIFNNTNKTIKYVTFNLKAFNAVGDPVYDCYKTRQGIGPVPANETGSWTFDNCWLYNSTIDRVRITSMSIEYMDRTKLNISDPADVTLNLDITDKYLELTDKKNAMVDAHIDSLYTAEKQKHDMRIAKELERKKFVEDSTLAAAKRAKDSTDLAMALSQFRLADQSLRKRLADTEESILLLENVTNDQKKYDFVRTTFDRHPKTDLAKLRQNRTQLRKGLARPDTTSTTQLKAATNAIDNAANQYNEDSYQRIVQEVPAYGMIDQDFIKNPIKKTRLYQNNKEQYRQKKIEAIQPTKKHITAMYVYGGGKSPLGANLAIYPTNNIGVWAEYLTHGTIEGLTNDNPQDYADPQEANKLFQQIRQQNLYKLEDTWDKSYQTINLGVNVPFNYKKNLILGIGAGKSITTEHRRFSVPEDFYPNSTYRQPTTNNGNFYLDSERRTSSNLNFSANLTLILKPLTIKIGANINDRDRRDTRINIGIGLTF